MPREAVQTLSFRGRRSRNKVSVGEPAEGSLPVFLIAPHLFVLEQLSFAALAILPPDDINTPNLLVTVTLALLLQSHKRSTSDP